MILNIVTSYFISQTTICASCFTTGAEVAASCYVRSGVRLTVAGFLVVIYMFCGHMKRLMDKSKVSQTIASYL